MVWLDLTRTWRKGGVERIHFTAAALDPFSRALLLPENPPNIRILTHPLLPAAKESLSHLDTLNTLHREGLRLTEEESAILTEEPEDLIRNLDTLISVRSAFETELPVKPHLSNKPRNVKRAKLDIEAASKSPAPQSEVSTPVLSAAARGVGKGASRSGSVAAGSAKSENGGEVEVIKRLLFCDLLLQGAAVLIVMMTMLQLSRKAKKASSL